MFQNRLSVDNVLFLCSVSLRPGGGGGSQVATFFHFNRGKRNSSNRVVKCKIFSTELFFFDGPLNAGSESSLPVAQAQVQIGDCLALLTPRAKSRCLVNVRIT